MSGTPSFPAVLQFVKCAKIPSIVVTVSYMPPAMPEGEKRLLNSEMLKPNPRLDQQQCNV